MCKSKNAECVRAPTSPDLQASITQAHLAPPLCPPPHPHHPLPVRSLPETNQLGDPLTERSIVNRCLSAGLLDPLHCQPPLLSCPPSELWWGLVFQGHGEGGGGEGASCGQAISWLVFHPFFPPPRKPSAETEDHSLAPCPACSSLTGKRRHTVPRPGCESKQEVGVKRKPCPSEDFFF